MRVFPILVACFLATAVHAQDAERVEAATAYVNNPVQQGVMDSLLSVEGTMAQMGLLGGRIPAELQRRLAAIISEELDAMRRPMEEVRIQSMAATFTLEEINALNAFYSSPVGASAMKKMTPFMEQAMASIAPSFQQAQANLIRRIQTEMGQ